MGLFDFRPILMTNMPDKHALRRALLAERQAIDGEVRRRRDETIGERVLARFRSQPVRSLGVYWPIRNEPDLRPIYPQLAALGMQLALPVVLERAAPLGFAVWTPGEPLAKDALGLAVPAKVVEIRPEALLIPCLGFNAHKVRLGYGGGFYDRTLAAVPRPLAVGVAYANALVEFEADAHDIALDAVITD